MADLKNCGQEIAPVAPGTVGRTDLQGLLEPERLLSRYDYAIARTCFPALRAIDDHASPDAIAQQEQGHREALKNMLARSATQHELGMIDKALRDATTAAPNEGVIEACLAALIDTRVKLPHNLPVYLEALIYDLKDEGFPPAVVAAACQRIRRESVFLPEISEVLAVCRETLTRYRERKRTVAKALEDRRAAEAFLARLTAPKMPADEVREEANFHG
ncbi:hypothetical protein MKK50_16190 [Methylobacterium sp. J-043]|nr:hypothetical protein [Methylobacterium sp. J-043]